MGNKKGFTLIELIMVILLIGILVGTGSYLVVYFAQNMVQIPRVLQVDMISSDILDIMCEGDSAAQGLRFSSRLLSAGGNYLRYRDAENRVVELRYGAGKIYRRIGYSTWEVVPYYFTGEVNVSLIGGQLFRYYDRNDNEISPSAGNLDRIKRIEIKFKVKFGSISGWGAQRQIVTSVYINTFV